MLDVNGKIDAGPRAVLAPRDVSARRRSVAASAVALGVPLVVAATGGVLRVAVSRSTRCQTTTNVRGSLRPQGHDRRHERGVAHCGRTGEL
jgi:hypothetical protein